jgi:hypothetical protein
MPTTCLLSASAEPLFTRLTPVPLPPEDDKTAHQDDIVHGHIKPAEDDYSSVGVASWG